MQRHVPAMCSNPSCPSSVDDAIVVELDPSERKRTKYKRHTKDRKRASIRLGITRPRRESVSIPVFTDDAISFAPGFFCFGCD